MGNPELCNGFVSVVRHQGLTCQAGPEFGHRQHTAAHPPWRSGSSAHPPTSLYSVHSLAGLRREGVAERWMNGEDKGGDIHNL